MINLLLQVSWKKEFFMKNILKIVGIIALVAVIGFTMFACGSPSGGGGKKPDPVVPKTRTYTGTADGTTYSLKITEKLTKAAYDPKGGDSYELTVSGEASKSTGTVESKTSDTLTLKPSKSGETFTASVSGDSLTSLEGEITLDNNTKIEAPGELKPEDPPTPGDDKSTLTITGLPIHELDNGFGPWGVYILPGDEDISTWEKFEECIREYAGTGSRIYGANHHDSDDYLTGFTTEKFEIRTVPGYNFWTASGNFHVVLYWFLVDFPLPEGKPGQSYIYRVRENTTFTGGSATVNYDEFELMERPW
jgi:hypothetical protein